MLRDFFREEKEQPPSFIQAIEEQEDVYIIRLKGPIDMFTIPGIAALKQKAKERRGALDKQVLLDFKNVTHVDGATCAMLVSTLSELEQKNHKLILINISKELMNMMEISKIKTLFSICESEKEALKELKKEES